MASISKGKTGWRVQVAIQGVRKSRTFSTKVEASASAAQRETEIQLEKATGVRRGRTVDDASPRYEKEISVHKRGHEKEVMRLSAVGRLIIDEMPLKDWRLVDVTPEVLSKWRDNRLKGSVEKNFTDAVLGSSENRDLTLLPHMFGSAAREWKWIAKSSTTNVRRPADPPPRDSLYTEDEIDRLCAHWASTPTSSNQSKVPRSAWASLSYSRSRPPCAQAKSAA